MIIIVRIKDRIDENDFDEMSVLCGNLAITSLIISDPYISKNNDAQPVCCP